MAREWSNGLRRRPPIHYGVSGLEEYVEVEDPIGQLHKAAREKSVGIQPVTPGEWVDWGLCASGH